MPSYRFCRPDDIPYLARAINECFHVHFPHLQAMTVERYRAEMKDLDVWPSNSMVASSEAGPVAVLIGTKRTREVMISRVGVLPGHQRRGHGSHLLNSLSQTLAVLGPERLIAEVPRSLPGIGDFFVASDYRHETVYVDWQRPASAVEPVPEDWLLPTTVAELTDQELLEPGRDVAWERATETLVNRRDGLEGLAIASAERLEAYLLFDRVGDRADVLALGGRESEQRDLFLGLLLRAVASRTGTAVRIPKLAPDEVPSPVLESLGFVAGEVWDRYAATATPG